MQVPLALGLAALLGAGFAGNEVSHGAMAEAMGLGHHHMMDYDGAHCASLDGPMAAQHVGHMHGGDWNATHAGCGGMHHGMMGGRP